MVWTLGPALIGLRSFLGLDLLGGYLPYARTFPVTGPVDNIFIRDTIDSLLPSYVDFHARLGQGDVASWAPYAAGGSPAAALPSLALFSPLSLPYWVLPTWLAPAFGQLLQIVLSVGATYAFLRRLSASPLAGWVGGLVFAASGYMIAWVNWPQTRVGAFIPVLFWALERFAQLRTPRAAALIALAVAGLLLGGFPAVAGLALYAGGAYLVVRLLAERATTSWPATVRAAGLALGAVIVGVGLSAVQLLPFVSYLGSLDLSYRTDQFGNTTPLKYLTAALFPQSFFANVYGAGTPYSRELNPVEISMHVGSVAIVLVLVALCRGAAGRPRGALTFLAAATALGLWLIFVQGPLVSWLGVLPVFEGNPIGRVRAVVGFTAAALAGLGLDALLAGARRARSRRLAERVALPAALLTAGVLGILVYRAQTPLLGDLVRTDILVALAAMAVAIALVLLVDLGRVRRVVTVVLPLLVAVQGIIAVGPYWQDADPDLFYPETPAHRFLAEAQGSERIAATGAVLVPNATTAYGLRLVGGHSFVSPTWGELLRAIDPRSFVAPTIATLDPGAPALAGSPGLDRLAARYYVSGDDAPVPGVVEPSGEADGPVTASYGTPSTASIDPGPLRGVGFSLLGQGRLSPQARVVVEVRDAQDEVLARGERPIPNARVPSDVYVPLAAENAEGPGPWTVDVTFADRIADGPGPDLRGSAGAPRLLLVRPAPDGLRLVAVLDGVTIYERDNALSRIRWAGRAEVITDAAERIATVAGTPLPADEVVLSEPGPAGSGAAADLDVVEDSGDTVRVTVDAAGDGYLVLADAVQDGWVVTVDGQPAELVAADHALGAVHVEAGRHDVAFRYAPAGRTVGSVITLVSGLALVVVFAAAYVRRRPQHDRPARSSG